jgi:predicted nucleic acid-binding protein
MNKLFIDSDIVLDLLLERQGFYIWSARLFTLKDKGRVDLFVSALAFNNINYMLSKNFGKEESRRILSRFKLLVNVLAVDNRIISLALSSSFADFEDAIQYYCAIENKISLLITRNIKDYKLADIPVMTAETYLKTHR